MGIKTKMKTTFLLTMHHTLQSAIVDRAQPHTLRVGDRLHLEQGFTTPWGEIPGGLDCYVDHVNEENGALELYVPQYVAALEPWGKFIILVPFMTDDTVGLFRHVAEMALTLCAA